jgi:hypothetical protein
VVDLAGWRCYMLSRYDQRAQRAATYDLGVLGAPATRSFVPIAGPFFALGEFHDFDGFGLSLDGAPLRLPAAT